VRRVVAGIDPELPVQSIRTMRDVLYVEAFDRAAMAALLNLFGAVGLALAVLGIYGVTSYGVSLRTREIAIRMGFGASARDVLGLIVASGLRLVGAGIAIGLFGAWALGRVIRGLLDDVSPTDPLVLGAVGLLASWAPARRAMRIEPMQALRVE
jgi:ABC-type antimicrobial peptide transport system permease subunit